MDYQLVDVADDEIVEVVEEEEEMQGPRDRTNTPDFND